MFTYLLYFVRYLVLAVNSAVEWTTLVSWQWHVSWLACMWCTCQGGAASCDESDPEYGRVAEPVKPAGARSSLVDALLLVPSSVGDTTSTSRPHPHSHRRLHVPYVVSVCCQHLQTYGQLRSLQFRLEMRLYWEFPWVPWDSHVLCTVF